MTNNLSLTLEALGDSDGATYYRSRVLAGADCLAVVGLYFFGLLCSDYGSVASLSLNSRFISCSTLSDSM
jgi:hypothetical protein